MEKFYRLTFTNDVKMSQLPFLTAKRGWKSYVLGVVLAAGQDGGFAESPTRSPESFSVCLRCKKADSAESLSVYPLIVYGRFIRTNQRECHYLALVSHNNSKFITIFRKL